MVVNGLPCGPSGGSTFKSFLLVEMCLNFSKVGLVSSAGWGVLLRLNFLLGKTQSEEVQQDADYHHFMWVQCRREYKSACAQIVYSAFFCHSSQNEMC